jgi:hypothetical protein
MYETSASEIEVLALDFGLITLRARQQPDALGRSDVSWTLICLQLPDDATVALALLRSVILNDPKSSTYKLALLRVIARVRTAQPGWPCRPAAYTAKRHRAGAFHQLAETSEHHARGSDIELKHGRATAAMHEQELSIGRRPGCFRAGLC